VTAGNESPAMKVTPTSFRRATTGGSEAPASDNGRARLGAAARRHSESGWRGNVACAAQLGSSKGGGGWAGGGGEGGECWTWSKAAGTLCSALCPGEAPAGSTNQERAAATLQLTWGLAEFLFWIQTNTNFDFLLEKNS
jgi:hypothetical protein